MFILPLRLPDEADPAFAPGRITPTENMHQPKIPPASTLLL
ncbi:hypothetical protein SNE35_29755 [Paucibacter sp. R3-3]|uniref:Uncharacterized protein n=1 Tax=Roseateles agri TaxID=3098619 RepID=A0ABU5DQX1_9BURK|nr:hypothetical protein [Paucibacter sp. R3-3]